jgi:hypothetical protein
MALLFCVCGETYLLSAQTSGRARKFDEFGDAQLSDIAARLDNFCHCSAKRTWDEGLRNCVSLSPGLAGIEQQPGCLVEELSRL